MNWDITLQDWKPTDVVALTETTTIERIGDTVRDGYARLFEGLGREGIAPSGPPRLVYRQMRDEEWTIEMCVPVADGADTPGDLTRRRFEGGRAATLHHVGPYDQLGAAYGALEAWIDEQGLQQAGPPFDVYISDPGEVTDPSKLETEIVWPVR